MSAASKFLALCGLLAACDGGEPDQLLTGRVDTSQGALAIRAVSTDDAEVIVATPVRTDGSFTLTLPAGDTYRIEVLTRTGVRYLVRRSGNVLRDLSFKVCQPVDPFDVGDVGAPNTDGLCMAGDPSCTPCDPMTGTDCEKPPEPCTDPSDPNCKQPCDVMDETCEPPPPPCTDPMDPACWCDVVQPDGTCCSSADPSCGKCQPGDPNCEPPPPCDPANDPMCCYADGTCEPPPPCDPTIDPACGCKEDGTCPPPPCLDPSDPNCGGGCTDPNAPGCVPPCSDPMDPTTCKDPCAEDPAACGCMVAADGTANCWPTEPQPCCDPNGMCDPSDGMAPDNVPGDFGCEGM
jgi:hypothetical protein